MAHYDFIYKTEYGFLFIRSFVLSFSRAVSRTRAANTEVEMGLEFNQTASPAEIPQDDAIAKTLEEAFSNPNITFNISVDVTSIRLKPIYRRRLSSFRSLTVILFSNGSIYNTMNLEFASTSVPSGTQIGNVLADAASSITAFNIETASIFLDGAQVSNGVSHKMSLITASFLVLLSWLLSSFQ
ncbi:hypothetical protein F7725_004498 [Dissostichus mawsoni]|uniref:SEA domain-containing protein n=1 Tax=Dissostichus mawsoni TaxID=36200 RepID=A0A7J5XIZ8_DISMA|nr:hypothetical protein F7725_004498 [Dissostichus mawsoni]